MKNLILSSFLSLFIATVAFAQRTTNIPSDSLNQKIDSVKKNGESTHYMHQLISYNDYNLGKGQGMYQNNWLLFNNLSIGISDHLTLNTGIFFGGPAWVGLKLGFPIIRNRINLGVSSTLFFTRKVETEAIHFGQITIGRKESNFTLGIGKNSSSNTVMTIKGILKINHGIYLFTESYFFDFDDPTNGLISISGFRFALKNRRSSIDLGILAMPEINFDEDSNLTTFIPLIGFSIPLHMK